MFTFPIQRLHRLGVDVPPALAAVAATWDAAQVIADADPTVLIAEGLRTGTINADNVGQAVHEAAQALAGKEYARRVVADLERPLLQRERAAVVESGDDIIKGLRPVFREDVVVLTESVKAFGPSASDSAVLAAGPAAVEGWARRQEAVRRLDEVRRVVQALVVAGYGEPDPLVAWFLVDTQRLDVAQASMAEGRFVALVEAGFELRLNTAAEVHKLVASEQRSTAKVAAAEAQRKQAEKDARKAELEQERRDVEEQRRAMLARAGGS